MNTAAVTQAVSDFPWGLVLIAFVVGGLVWLWRSGKLGKPTEDKIKAEIREAKGELAAKIAKWTARNEPIEAPIAGTLQATPLVRDKTTRLAENAALLVSGAITQADADAAKLKILAE